MDSTRQLLDELMGKDRNLLPHEKSDRGLKFSDPGVCKHFLCGFCPSDLFTNTKSDLGPCTKVHDDVLKDQFQSDKHKDGYPFEADWIHYLERLINDLDRRIKKGHDRLDTQDIMPEIPLTPQNKEQVDTITNRIQELLKQMEELGEEGRVDEAQALMRSVDRLKTEKEALLRAAAPVPGAIPGQEKRMKVCEICGAFLVIGDTDKRMASHLEGKQHLGYAKIREAIDAYRTRKEDERKKRRESGISEPAHSIQERDRERDRDRDRNRERGDRDRDRDRRGGDRDRERDRDRDRDRNRIRERDRDGDDKDRKDRKRGRDDDR